MLPHHQKLKELLELVISLDRHENKRLEKIQSIIDIWEQMPVEPGLTALTFKDNRFSIYRVIDFILMGLGVESRYEEVYLNTWKRMVKQVIRHDGMEDLYHSFYKVDGFKPVHLDFYLEQGLDLLAPEKQAQLFLVILCKSETFFPQLQRFIEDGKLDLLMRSTSGLEFGTVGGFIIRESRHPSYIKAVLSTGIHPDKFWTAFTYHTLSNQDREYLSATAFQYLCYDFSDKFELQFSSYWNANWYEPYIDTLNLLLEHGADYHLVHSDSPHAYPSAVKALDNALLSIQGKGFSSKWKACIEAAQALRSQFYDHTLHQKLSHKSKNHSNKNHGSKSRI